MQDLYHNIFLPMAKIFTFHYVQRIFIVRDICNPLWYIFITHSLRGLLEDLIELGCFSVSLNL